LDIDLLRLRDALEDLIFRLILRDMLLRLPRAMLKI
jgi:hypothetical protein